jgi:hypothetical protein
MPLTVGLSDDDTIIVTCNDGVTTSSTAGGHGPAARPAPPRRWRPAQEAATRVTVTDIIAVMMSLPSHRDA